MLDNFIEYSYRCSEKRQWGYYIRDIVHIGDGDDWILTYNYCVPINAKGSLNICTDRDFFRWGPNLKKFLILNDYIVNAYPDSDKFNIEVKIKISHEIPIYKVEKLVRIFNRLFDKFLRKQWGGKK